MGTLVAQPRWRKLMLWLLVLEVLCSSNTAAVQPASLQLLWSTPFYKSSTSPSTINNPRTMSELRRLVMTGYNRFMQTEWAAECAGKDTCIADRRVGVMAERPNEQFFKHQRESFEERQANARDGGALSSLFGAASSVFTGLPELEASPIASVLRDELLMHVTKYLVNIGQPAPNADVDIFMWATVHDSCVSHLPHVHEDSMVSGVFYLTVPPGAGALILEDPRGMHSPFGNRVIHQPDNGQVVLFPSWLVHHVAPSCGNGEDEPRISLAFNVIGNWEVTADASLGMAV